MINCKFINLISCHLNNNINCSCCYIKNCIINNTINIKTNELTLLSYGKNIINNNININTKKLIIDDKCNEVEQSIYNILSMDLSKYKFNNLQQIDIIICRKNFNLIESKIYKIIMKDKINYNGAISIKNLYKV